MGCEFRCELRAEKGDVPAAGQGGFDDFVVHPALAVVLAADMGDEAEFSLNHFTRSRHGRSRPTLWNNFYLFCYEHSLTDYPEPTLPEARTIDRPTPIT